MELRHLRSCLAVAESLSFVRAPKALHLSQPALIAQMRNLEEDLEVQPFVRNRRMVRLTPAGILLVKEAEEIVERASKAVDRVRKAVHD
jgi:DNA-binding transcriptional LysR family regulator